MNGNSASIYAAGICRSLKKFIEIYSLTLPATLGLNQHCALRGAWYIESTAMYVAIHFEEKSAKKEDLKPSRTTPAKAIMPSRGYILWGMKRGGS